MKSPVKEKNFSIMGQIITVFRALFKDDDDDVENEKLQEELINIEKEQNSKYIKDLEKMLDEKNDSKKNRKKALKNNSVKNTPSKKESIKRKSAITKKEITER